MKPSALLLLAFASLVLPSPAAQTGHAVYRPGLTQARIPLGSDLGYKTATGSAPKVLASNLLEKAEASWLDRTLDVFKDGNYKKLNSEGKWVVVDDTVNPVSGKTWPWLLESGYGIFAYEGEIYLEEGTDYWFYGRFKTGEALVVDGETVVWQGNGDGWNGPPEIQKKWTAPKTGWFPFNGWLWTSKGGSLDPQWSEWALQYNLEGVVIVGDDRATAKNETTNVWHRFADPGNGTFLRTTTTNRFTTVTASADDPNGRSFDLSFENVPTNAQLVAYSGPVDGLHDTNGWRDASIVLAEIPPGTSTTNVVVSHAADATVLRFRLAHLNPASTDGLENFEEWTVAHPLTEAPVVRLDSVSPGYTNVVVAGSLESFGIGGNGAVVTVDVADADDATFLDPVSSVVLPPFSSVGDFEVELFGLSTNAAYLVRATATNQFGAPGVSASVAFSTRDPGPPSASVAATIRGYQTATFRATVSDWGGGSWGAEAWIDVSEDDTFPVGATQTLPLGSLSGTVPATVVATAEGLTPDTDHHARLRVTNSWGVAFVSETVSFRTSDVPLGFHEPEVVTSVGYVSSSLSPSFVVPGTVYDVELFAAGPGYSGTWGTWNSENDDPPFTWGRKTAAGRDVLIRYTVDWRYPATGASGQIVIEATTTAKLADRTVDRLPAIDPDYSDDDGRRGSYLRPGDTVELIPSDGARIDWHTNAVLSIVEVPREGTNSVFVLEALEPGATLLYETDLETGKTNNVTGIAIVLPDGNPPGGVYVHRALKSFDWTDSSEWEMVSSGPQGYPDAIGAYAYIVTPNMGSSNSNNPGRQFNITNSITIGYLAIGQLGWIHHNLTDKSHWSLILDDENVQKDGSLTFKTADGTVSWIRLLGHSYITSRVQFQIPIETANDLEIDELNRIQDSTGWYTSRDVGIMFEQSVDIGTNVFRTVRAHPFCYNYGNRGYDDKAHTSGIGETGWISFWKDILGSGTIRLEAATLVGLVGKAENVKSFTGVWDVGNDDLNPRVNGHYGAASLNLSSASLGNAKEMIIRGSWHRADQTWPRGALVRTGYWTRKKDENVFAWTNDWQDALPPKITLDGGTLQLYPQRPASGTNRFTVSNLTIKAGPMGRLESRFTNSDNKYLSGYPNVFTTITNLVLESDAVVSFEHDASKSGVINEFAIVNESADWGWTPESAANRQFLPFFFANNQREGSGGNTIAGMSVYTPDNTKLAFRDRTTGKVFTTNTVDVGGGYKRWTAGETLANNNSYFSMQLAQNVTNSFEEGATVYNLAGYLDMRGGAVLGPPTNAVSSACTLDFGDQPARIFNGNWGETNVIGCRLAGSAGLVKGGNGVTILAAPATGISGGVRVAGGTLELLEAKARRADGTNVIVRGRVAGDVRVEAGSRLVVGSQKSFAPRVRLFLNDRDWIPSYAHVRL